jgi:hypothetical protein
VVKFVFAIGSDWVIVVTTVPSSFVGSGVNVLKGKSSVILLYLVDVLVVFVPLLTMRIIVAAGISEIETVFHSTTETRT